MNEMERSNLPDKEFKVMVIKLLIILGKRIDEHSENFNRDLKNIKIETIRAKKIQ